MDYKVRLFKTICVVTLLIIAPCLLQGTNKNTTFIQSFIFISFLCFVMLKIKNNLSQIYQYTFSTNTEHNQELGGLDCGTFMAYSYYYGYLRLILPSTGSINKGILEKIENIEDIHRITIAIHKLLILIPSSAYIPPDLKEASYQWMESAMDLEDEVRNRAGVKRRSYHNSVYKIYRNGFRCNTPLYVVVEGATPLLILFEILKHAHAETIIYKKHCKDIVLKFYKKLRVLIDNDPECIDQCELIYYNDYNNNGTKINIAEVILEHLKYNI